MGTLTLNANNPGIDGLSPAAGDVFTFNVGYLDIISGQPVSTRQWDAVLNPAGVATTELPALSVGNGIFVVSTTPGWGWRAFSGYPDAPLTLEELFAYQVQPDFITPILSSPTVLELLGGGNTGDVFTKASDANLNAGWAPPADLGLSFEFLSPLGTWTVTHNLGRRPVMKLYDLDGNGMLADTTATETTATAIFATPQPGYLICV